MQYLVKPFVICFPFFWMFSILWQKLPNTGNHRNKKGHFMWNFSTWLYSARTFFGLLIIRLKLCPTIFSPQQLHGIYSVLLVLSLRDIVTSVCCLFSVASTLVANIDNGHCKNHVVFYNGFIVLIFIRYISGNDVSRKKWNELF